MTQALNQSLPDQWARSHELLISTRHYLVLMPIQCARSELVCFNKNQITFSVIKAESLYQLRIFLDVRLKLGFKSEIASYAWYI